MKKSLREYYDKFEYIYYLHNFKLATDFFKSYTIFTLVSRATMHIGYSVFSVVRHRSRAKTNTTINSFKEYKDSKSIYNRSKIPRVRYNLPDYF